MLETRRVCRRDGAGRDGERVLLLSWLWGEEGRVRVRVVDSSGGGGGGVAL
jgi:hypothetical protein